MTAAHTKRIKIHVTHADIKRGYPCCVRKCPVALAISRKLPSGWKVKVSVATGYVLASIRGSKNGGDGLITHYFQVPKKLSNFVQAFDRAQKVRPFSFILDFPIAVLK